MSSTSRGPGDDPFGSDAYAKELRARAETALRDRGTTGEGKIPHGDELRLIHELEVHQVELEMQNEVLRESRDEVERQRARYTELYSSAPTGYVTLAPNGTMAESNTAAARLLGRESASLVGKRLGAFVIDADRAALNTFLDDIFRTGLPQHCELALGTAAQATRTVQMDGVRGRDGTECHVSLSDVTARRRAEAALRLRDRAIRAVSQGIVITDPSQPGNPIIYTNPGFELLTGYTAMEAAGRNCRFLQGKDTDAEAVTRLRTAIARGEPCAVELLNYRKDGTPFWNALFVTPVRDDAGMICQFIGVQVDVTKQRELERSLQQSQRMEAVGRLAGGIAHDFNNLLTVINGYADILQAEFANDASHRDMASEISRAGERAATLTHQLLAFSRSQLGDPTVLDLSTIVAELEPTMRQLAGDGIELRLELTQAPLLVRVDPGQIGQVLMNLVVNAREAMPSGGKLTVRVEPATPEAAARAGHNGLPPNAYVLLSVSDTGRGMQPETMARVFDPFFTTKAVGAGPGLGLSLVYGVIKQSNGLVKALSEPGLGTTISICLPSANEGR